jgi:hypothetical protein
MIAAENEKHRWRFHYAHGKAEDLLIESDVFYCNEPMPDWTKSLIYKHKTYAAYCKLKDHKDNLHDAIIITVYQRYNDTGGYLVLLGDKQGITEVMQYEEFDFLTKEQKQVTIDYISKPRGEE